MEKYLTFVATAILTYIFRSHAEHPCYCVRPEYLQSGKTKLFLAIHSYCNPVISPPWWHFVMVGICRQAIYIIIITILSQSPLWWKGGRSVPIVPPEPQHPDPLVDARQRGQRGFFRLLLIDNRHDLIITFEDQIGRDLRLEIATLASSISLLIIYWIQSINQRQKMCKYTDYLTAPAI